MRTMFLSHDKNSPKKRYQKPNILRRKPKVSSVRSSISDYSESLSNKPLVTASHAEEPKSNEFQIDRVTKLKSIKPCLTIKRSLQKFKLDTIFEENICQEIDTKAHKKNLVTFASLQINNNEETQASDINIESFLNSTQVIEENNLFDIDVAPKKESSTEEKSCLDFLSEPDKRVIDQYDGSQMISIDVEQKANFINSMIPLSAVSSYHHESRYQVSHIVKESLGSSDAAIQNMAIEHNFDTSLYKCDAPLCNKEFPSEQKLRKHKITHNKDNAKSAKQTTVECPVKKVAGNHEVPCGKIFHVREELLKHINDDHTPEDAPYRCDVCGRRFFWASGLRSHQRTHHAGAARALACGWPGCGRVFRLPCRLREHTRAHTGDKPYPCRHPNCGWSFRTASKLERHARRHTGERRHACATCGRAFRRRDHLRDHHTRYHAPHARATYACPHDGCQRSCTNRSSLYLHMKKVHRNEEKEASTLAEVSELTPVGTDTENMFTVSLMHDTSAFDVEREDTNTVEAETAETAETAAGEWRAARTHCPWPLPDRAQPAFDYSVDCAYILAEDEQVEQSASSESNIYTVRSDLFLHGNVLNNEDSENMRAGDGGAEGAALPLDADLGLLDAPSTIDLMQEELMYTDAAVDESSFQVLLLNGDELG